MHTVNSAINTIGIDFAEDLERAKLAVDDSGYIYLTDKTKVYVFDSNGKKSCTIPLESYANIAAGDKGVYTFLGDGLIKHFDQKGVLLKEYDFRDTAVHIKYRGKMQAIDNKIFSMDSENDKNVINIFDLNGGKVNKIEIDGILSFSHYKDKKILILTNAQCCGSHLIIYDYEKKEKLKEIEQAVVSSFFNYNANEDIIYSMTGVCIQKVSIESVNGSVKETFSNGIIRNRGTFLEKKGVCYSLNIEKKKNVIIKKEAFSSAGSMTVALNQMLFDSSKLSRITEQFNREYPEINAKFKMYEEKEYIDVISKSVMAGDKEIDMFFLTSDMANGFIKNNAMEDLKKYKQIHKKFNSMFDGVEGLCTFDGRLFGVPVGIINYNNVFLLNSELAEKEGISAPKYGWSWEDFEKLSLKLKETNSNYMIKNHYKDFWYGCMHWPYDSVNADMVRGEINYDTNVLAEKLKLTKKFYDEGYISDIDSGRLSGQNEDNVLLKRMYLPDVQFQGGKIIPAPVVKGDSAYPFWVYYLCMNKNSGMKKYAAAFLEKCISEESQASDTIMSGPILYKDKNLYKNSRYKDFITDEWNYNVYKYMLQNSHRLEAIDVSFKNINDYIDQFMKGKISEQEAAGKIDEKMRIIICE